MAAFRRRPGLFEAIQWTGDNEDEVRRLVEGSQSSWQTESARWHATSLKVASKPVPKDGWIVLDDRGFVSVLNAAVFAETFEPADDTECPHGVDLSAWTCVRCDNDEDEQGNPYPPADDTETPHA
jgi:hypothetical protein